MQVPSGTRESRRTVVPFLYNLGPEIDELDVVDFPGVDDSDEVIRYLCDILYLITQLVIFVVDHRCVHWDSTSTRVLAHARTQTHFKSIIFARTDTVNVHVY